MRKLAVLLACVKWANENNIMIIANLTCEDEIADIFLNYNERQNLIDEYKGMSNDQIFDELEKKRNSLEVAIENVEHDFNIGTIVRNANSSMCRSQRFMRHCKTTSVRSM